MSLLLPIVLVVGAIILVWIILEARKGTKSLGKKEMKELRQIKKLRSY